MSTSKKAWPTLKSLNLPKAKVEYYEDEPRWRKWRWVLAALLVVLGGAGTVWAVRYFGAQSKMAEIRDMWTKMEDTPEKDRREMFGDMRKKMDELPESQRDQLRAEGMARREKAEGKRLQDFFAMTPVQQAAELDKEIQRQLEREKRREERKKQQQGQGSQGGSGGGNGSGDANGQASTDNSKGGGNGNASQQNGGWQSMSQDQRNQRRDAFLSRTPAPDRAQMSINRQLSKVFQQMVQGRAQQQGITLPQGGGGGFGR